MADKRYNGWTNYETWNVKLWMDNNEGDYKHYASLAQDAYDEASSTRTFTREEMAAGDLAKQLQDEYESAMQDILEQSGQTASVWADLLGAALSEVNWHEIAEHMIEDCDKEENAVADDSANGSDT